MPRKSKILCECADNLKNVAAFLPKSRRDIPRGPKTFCNKVTYDLSTIQYDFRVDLRTRAMRLERQSSRGFFLGGYPNLSATRESSSSRSSLSPVRTRRRTTPRTVQTGQDHSVRA